jgi:hypothetical protein
MPIWSLRMLASVRSTYKVNESVLFGAIEIQDINKYIKMANAIFINDLKKAVNELLRFQH